jgi:hypothetical protein
MKEGVRDVDPEKGTAERKARLEKKRGMKMDDHPQYKKEEVELDENRAAARAAGGYKDDSKKQPDPSKKGFTGVGNMSIDAIRKMSARIEKEKTQKEEVENVEELYKGKHGQSEKEYQDSRSDGGKMVSGDSKRSGAAYSSRAVKNTGPNPAGGSKKPQGQGRMTSGARAELQYRKANMRKEEASMSPQEVQLQKKKAMLDKMIATKRMQGLKNAKKSEAPTKAMGEAKELSIDDQMRISREANAKRKPYQPGDRQKQRAAQIKQMAKNAAKDTRTDAQKMTDATGPRPGSRYRGD